LSCLFPFRSAPSRRERRAPARLCGCPFRRFDPRPREESDAHMDAGLANGSQCFDPRPREESDVAAMLWRHSIRRFDPRPREESDRDDTFR